MGGRKDRRAGAERARPPTALLSALDCQIGAGPVLVGNAGLAGAAIGHRSAPEADLVEVVAAVGLAAGVTEQGIAGAGRRHDGDAAEPGGEIALELRLQGMLE